MGAEGRSRMSEGVAVLLVLEDERRFLVHLQAGRTFSTHKGAIRHDALLGHPYGGTFETNTGAAVVALYPTWVDRMMKVQRTTNIMYPKDVAYLIAELGIGAGDRVVELGSGSGAMTIALAHAVAPGGRVFSYDRREEHIERARDNCGRAGVDLDMIEFRLRGTGEPLPEDIVGVMCDIPEPWDEVGAARERLVGSGRFAAAIPTFNQAEKLAACLVGEGFAMVRTIEILVREILARPGRTRPAHRMVGHTQLLTTAVKVSGPIGASGEAAS
jgi:tRNA (adenine57-N1/adenine58-N1)-methyltransferase